MWIRHSLSWVLLAGMLLYSASARAAIDMFLNIDAVEGESQDKAHAKEIDVLAWSWGLSNSGSVAGGGAGAGKVSVQDLSLTKWLDKSSPVLMLAACNGKHFDKAVLTLRKAGDKPLEYLVITMENVLVTSVSTGGSGGEDRLTENVTFQFGKVKLVYTMELPTGGAGEKSEFGWNIIENVKY